MGKYLSKLRQSLSAERFPFERLPDVCKMHVFSYLDVADRVAVSMVCKEWNNSIRSPKLWVNVDVREAVKQSQRKQSKNVETREFQHRTRAAKFLSYVSEIDPFVKRLVLVGDIADPDFNERVQLFTQCSKLSELQELTVDWTRSVNSSAASPETAITSSQDGNHRRRQRLFVRFFGDLSQAAPNLKCLTLPFNWSPCSVDALLRLEKLESITLMRYSDLQTLDITALFEQLVSGLNELRRLTIEVWTARASGGLTYFKLNSNSLEYVDASQSRGVAFGEINLPNVRELRVSRHPWNGPLVMPSSTASAVPPPCLYQLLVRGASSLLKLNDLVLRSNWQSELYNELDDVLKLVCPCEMHYCICASASEDMCM